MYRHFNRLIVLAFLFIFSTTALLAQSQRKIRGAVLDQDTRRPIPFARIQWGDRVGVIADADGAFELTVPDSSTGARVDMLSYQGKWHAWTSAPEQIIFLKVAQQSLGEVVIRPGENPAHRIIKRASEERYSNNPENHVAFRYSSYQKLRLTAMLPDSLGVLREAIDSMYLFLAETKSTRQFKNKREQRESIEASRISGMKQASFGILASQLQPANIFEDQLSFNGVNFVSPLVKNSPDLYRFEWTDTLLSGIDTVFVISYEPRKGKNFDGLKGVLYIHSGNFAVQQVLAEPFKTSEVQLGARYEQQYTKVNNYWFPEQLITYIKFKNEGIGKGGYFVGESRTYNQDIKVLPPDSLRLKSIFASTFDADAGRKSEPYWQQERVNPLSQKELTTYGVIDSVVQKENLEWLLRAGEYLLKDEFPLGYLSLVPSKLMAFNGYEGFRLGAGLKTNDRLMKRFSVDGYFAYGFKDKDWKWGTGATWQIDREKRYVMRYQFKHDVEEPGKVDFKRMRSGAANSESFRNLLVSRMDQVERHELGLSMQVSRSLQVSPFVAYEFRQMGKYGVSYVEPLNDGLSLQVRQFSAYRKGFMVYWNPGQKLDQLMGTIIPISSRQPIVQAFGENISMPEFRQELWRFRVQIDHKFESLRRGIWNYRLKAGFASAEAPYSYLIQDMSNYSGQFGVNSFGSFETMPLFGYAYNRFVSTHHYWDFRNLLFRGKKFNPGLILVVNAMIGDYQAENIASNQVFRVPNEGYVESGLVVSNIIKSSTSSFGLGVFSPVYAPGTTINISSMVFKLNLSYRLD